MISINKLKNQLADKLFGEDYYGDCSEFEQYVIREELKQII